MTLTAEVARARIRAAIPVAARSLHELGRSTDSVAYLVDGAWVCRFPVAANAQRTLRRELALLEPLAATLPLAALVPRLVALTRRERAEAEAAFDRYERDHRPDRAPLALLHGDLKPAHVLRDPAAGELTGVLDWGDVTLGNPDFDLAIVGVFFGEGFLRRLLEHLPGRDPAVVIDKARFFTLLRGLQDAPALRRAA